MLCILYTIINLKNAKRKSNLWALGEHSVFENSGQAYVGQLIAKAE